MVLFKLEDLIFAVSENDMMYAKCARDFLYLFPLHPVNINEKVVSNIIIQSTFMFLRISCVKKTLQIWLHPQL